MGPSGFNSPLYQPVQETHLSLVSHPHPVWQTRMHPGTVTKTNECFLSLLVINIPPTEPESSAALEACLIFSEISNEMHRADEAVPLSICQTASICNEGWRRLKCEKAAGVLRCHNSGGGGCLLLPSTPQPNAPPQGRGAFEAIKKAEPEVSGTVWLASVVCLHAIRIP